ncbi:MAG: DctP family TRAP transporter solute-binding subunit [Spirochaetia bacterium]|nr:DctP family TRAP transporter solute-binding subunit [Spirochaetia bacterium]MCF7942351.1 DctP family TRAP transporter solute-binding subunit [Spirochaetia bacterium]
MRKAITVMFVLMLVFGGVQNVFAQGQKSTTDAQEVTTIQLSIPDPAQSSVGKMAAYFAQRVAEESDDTVKVEVYADGILFGGDQNSAINMLQDGGLDALVLSTSVYASFIPQMNAVSLPYLFANYDQFTSYLDGAPGQELLASLDKLNIKGLALSLRTYRSITNSKRPITEPADLKGIKIRVPNNRLWVDFFGGLGADPTPMNFGEVYTALQLKTIDAQENPVEVPLANKFYEVQNYLSLTNHIADSFALAMNKDVWNSLDAQTQALLQRVASEAADYKNTSDIAQEEKIVQELEELGMEVNHLTDAQVKMFQEEALKLYPGFEPMIGAEFVQKSLDFLNR